MAGFRIQFSLAALQLTVASVAVVLAIFLAPSRLGDACLAIMIVCLSAFCLVGIAYGSGNVRPFCLGASVPLGLVLLYFGTHLDQIFDMWWFITVERSRALEFRKMLATAIIGGIVLGYLCVGFRRLLRGNDSDSRPE
ncbi:MAG TPA: hypothetical protein VMV10_26805 [Pirellulales bacterium]|nr:hypothetical protein [Pirellulales bacterium]